MMNRRNHGQQKIDDCNKIIDGVVLGNYVSACKNYMLQRNGITHILTVGS